MKYKALTLALSTVLFLQGCSLTPEYAQPASPVASEWAKGEAYAKETAAAAKAADMGWRQFFGDETLRQLIGTALENNRDLRVAVLNVEAYRAQYRIQRSGLAPELGGSAGGSRQRLPADLSGMGTDMIASQYDTGLSVSYELDFFGRIRSLSQAALETYLATEEAQRSAHIALVAEVANAYLALRAYQALLALTRSTVKTYEDAYVLVKRSHEAGAVSELNVRQAESALADAQALLKQYTRQVAITMNGLQLLLGAPLPAELGAGKPLNDTILASFSSGLPSELLLNRPDILAAEHQLLAANANIGAARAAFFPSISLMGSAGTASSEVSGLFEGGSGSWRFMPSINLPIFNAGRLKASLDYAEIQKDIHVAQYEKTIQTAFREVSDGLAARGTFGEQLAAQQKRVDSTRRYYSLANTRYKAGIDSYLTVLDAQRQLLGAQQQVVAVQQAKLSSEVLLYKALGGGWHENGIVKPPIQQ